jgi:hypothetical protein
LKARPTLWCNVAAAVKMKQKVLHFFKLDDKTIYDLDPFSSITLSLLKEKAQNNFGHILHKECQVLAGEGKSQ